jgi:hypothetical protein
MKEIFLYRTGKEPLIVTIDDEFYNIISKQRWNVMMPNDQLAYATSIDTGKTVYMHRRIMEIYLGRFLDSKEEVDHIDNNGLNNQISNLRVVTRSQNMANQRHHRDSKSGYIGVHYNERYVNPYRVKLMFNSENIHVNKGFDAPEEAAEIRDILSIKYFGSSSKLNFPEKRMEYIKKLNSGFNPDENPEKDYTSEYNGVTFDKKYNKYRVSVYPSGQQVYVGTFSFEEEAAEHADMASILLVPNSIRLNFENKREEYNKKLSDGYNPIKSKKVARKSKYVGISFNDNQHSKWTAYVTTSNSERIHLGSFMTENEAVEIRDLAMLKIYGEDAKINYPDRREEYIEKLSRGFDPIPNRAKERKFIDIMSYIK